MMDLDDPPNMESRALTGMQGRLWIDRKTLARAMVEAEAASWVNQGFSC
jgi:hypothetical protein